MSAARGVRATAAARARRQSIERALFRRPPFRPNLPFKPVDAPLDDRHRHNHTDTHRDTDLLDALSHSLLLTHRNTKEFKKKDSNSLLSFSPSRSTRRACSVAGPGLLVFTVELVGPFFVSVCSSFGRFSTPEIPLSCLFVFLLSTRARDGALWPSYCVRPCESCSLCLSARGGHRSFGRAVCFFGPRRGQRRRRPRR